MILPYSRVLPVGLWDKLVELNKQGLKLLFVGPEPAYDSNGNTIPFARITGFKSFGPDSYLHVMANKQITISPNAWEPAFLDVIPEVEITKSQTGKIENFFHEMIALHNKSGIYWLPGLDPREDLIGILRKWHESPVKVYGNCIYRLFGQISDGVLVLAPRSGACGWGITPSCQEISGSVQYESKILPFDGIIKYNKKTYEFSGCEWAAIHFKNNEIVNALSEGNDFKINVS